MMKLLRKDPFLTKVNKESELGKGGDCYIEICQKCGYFIKYHYLKPKETPKFSTLICERCYGISLNAGKI